ncbi:hypothetical protein Lal_00008562 [Lupinus albus]|nr:hypothetical protein Lal_00008562 [Lupinus albus]
MMPTPIFMEMMKSYIFHFLFLVLEAKRLGATIGYSYESGCRPVMQVVMALGIKDYSSTHSKLGLLNIFSPSCGSRGGVSQQTQNELQLMSRKVNLLPKQLHTDGPNVGHDVPRPAPSSSLTVPTSQFAKLELHNSQNK